MDETKTIARLNIAHFRRRLAEERDETNRLIRQLLAEEEAKRTTLVTPSRERNCY
jgi:hypothetical protein